MESVCAGSNVSAARSLLLIEYLILGQWMRLKPAGFAARSAGCVRSLPADAFIIWLISQNVVQGLRGVVHVVPFLRPASIHWCTLALSSHNAKTKQGLSTPMRLQISPTALCALQLAQPSLETIPGENFTDIESNSTVSEDAAEAASSAAPEPPVRYITCQDPSCVRGRCLPACAKMHVTVCMPGKRGKACY
jgi:hypothetical protein